MAHAKLPFDFKDVDKGWKAILEAAQRISADKGAHAKAGYLGAAAQEAHEGEEPGAEPLTNVALGAIHEFGVPGRIPERSHIRATFDMHRERYYAELRRLVGWWFDRKGKMPLLQALRLMALRMSSDQKSRILTGEGIPPPNAPSTIARKLKKGAWKNRTAEETAQLMAEGRGPRPLVDTGRMVGSLSWAVENGKGQEEK